MGPVCRIWIGYLSRDSTQLSAFSLIEAICAVTTAFAALEMKAAAHSRAHHDAQVVESLLHPLCAESFRASNTEAATFAR